MSDFLASFDSWSSPKFVEPPKPVRSNSLLNPSNTSPSSSPHQQNGAGLPAGYAYEGVGQGQGQSGQHQAQGGGFLRVKIMALERNKKDLLIRFDANTNLPNFRTSLYKNVQRSYVEFQSFAEQLAVGNPHTIIPSLPLPTTSALTDDEDDRLVRIAIQRWFQRVCEDPALIGRGNIQRQGQGQEQGQGQGHGGEDEVRSFVESDFGYQPVIRHNAQHSGRTLSTTPITLTSNTPISSSSAFGLSSISKLLRRGPLDEDEDLSTAKSELEQLENRWGHVAANIGAVGKGRRVLAVAQADTGGKIASLSTVESSGELGAVYKKIGRVWENAAGLQQAQGVSDNIVIADNLGYQALNARAAKETLNHRTQVLEDAQNASKIAINKRRTVERLKGSSNINPAKVDDAIEEMREANEIDQQLADKVSAISVNLRHALQTHSRQAHDDAVLVLLEHARTKIMYEKQVLKDLEMLRPEIRNVGKATTASSSTAVQQQARAGPSGTSMGMPMPVNSGPDTPQSAMVDGRDPLLTTPAGFGGPSVVPTTAATAGRLPQQYQQDPRMQARASQGYDPMSASVPSLPSSSSYGPSQGQQYPSYTPYTVPGNMARGSPQQPQQVASPYTQQSQPPLGQPQFQQPYQQQQQYRPPQSQQQQPQGQFQSPYQSQQKQPGLPSQMHQPPYQSSQASNGMAQSMYVPGPSANVPHQQAQYPQIQTQQLQPSFNNPLGPGGPPMSPTTAARQGALLKGSLPVHRKGRLNDVAAARTLANNF